jgi:hypothetical protein
MTSKFLAATSEDTGDFLATGPSSHAIWAWNGSSWQMESGGGMSGQEQIPPPFQGSFGGQRVKMAKAAQIPPMNSERPAIQFVLAATSEDTGDIAAFDSSTSHAIWTWTGNGWQLESGATASGLTLSSVPPFKGSFLGQRVKTR